MHDLNWQVPLNREVRTPLSECYTVAGVTCAIQTNSKEILTSARDTFRNLAQPSHSPELMMRLWVDAKADSGPPWPQPYFRGSGHLIYAGFDRQNSLLLNLRRRRVIGRFSPSMILDMPYWNRVIFPAAAGLMSESLGVAALHCACVEQDGLGLLLSGQSGAGKSTLSLAMAQCGFALLSDDWTYFSRSQGQLSAWGLATPVKLLPDAASYFHELRSMEPTISSNGELAYEIDPESVFGVQKSLRCEPRWLVFLERQAKAGHSMSKVTPQEAAARLEFDLEDLPAHFSHVREMQRDAILSLVERECWLLRHGEGPQKVAQILSQFCANSVAAVRRRQTPSIRNMQFLRTGEDILRRFTPTPLTADLCAKGLAIRLRTNSLKILRLVQSALDHDACVAAQNEPFSWTVIADDNSDMHSLWPPSSHISADGLFLFNIGQRTFWAIDSQERSAIGFIAGDLLNDASGFEKFFLAPLFSVTMEAIDRCLF